MSGLRQLASLLRLSGTVCGVRSVVPCPTLIVSARVARGGAVRVGLDLDLVCRASDLWSSLRVLLLPSAQLLERVHVPVAAVEVPRGQEGERCVWAVTVLLGRASACGPASAPVLSVSASVPLAAAVPVVPVCELLPSLSRLVHDQMLWPCLISLFRAGMIEIYVICESGPFPFSASARFMARCAFILLLLRLSCCHSFCGRLVVRIRAVCSHSCLLAHSLPPAHATGTG